MYKTKLTSPIPNDTREALSLHNWQIDNIALLLNKYLDFFVEKDGNKEILDISFPKDLAFSLVVKDDDLFKIAMNKLIKIKHSGYVIDKNKLNGRFFTNLLNCNRRNKKNNSNKYETISFSIKLIGKGIYNYVEGNKTEGENKENCDLVNSFLRLKNKFEIYRNFLLKEIKQGKIKELLNKVFERQEHIADKTSELKTQTRLVVGLGSGSVLETSIKLHHIYGVPYIPASAIKGVLRAYRIWELAKWDEKNFKEIEKRIDENKPKGDKEEKIIKIFGNQQQKGKLIVLDAYPTNFKGFDIDIMNPHFPDYYDKDKAPADWQNPNPITFLAIPKGTTFKFFFKNANVYERNLKEDLKEVFKNIGIGGKTSLGYGILE